MLVCMEGPLVCITKMEVRRDFFILAGDSSTVSSPSPHTAAGTSSPLGEQPWA